MWCQGIGIHKQGWGCGKNNRVKTVHWAYLWLKGLPGDVKKGGDYSIIDKRRNILI